MGWEWIEGDTDVPDFTERHSFREVLLKEREQLRSQVEHHDIGNSSLIEETGELFSSSVDNHLADTASETSSWTLSRLFASISGPTLDSASVPRAVVMSFILAANFSAN